MTGNNITTYDMALYVWLDNIVTAVCAGADAAPLNPFDPVWTELIKKVDECSASHPHTTIARSTDGKYMSADSLMRHPQFIALKMLHKQHDGDYSWSKEPSR